MHIPASQQQRRAENSYHLGFRIVASTSKPSRLPRCAPTCVLLILGQVLLVPPEAPVLGGVRHVGLAAQRTG